MIQSVVGFCFMVGLSVAAPSSKKGAYAPAPLGERPPCAAKGMTFCEDVPKYPTKLIQKLLQMKSPDFLDFFVDESEGLDEPPEHVLLLNEDETDVRPSPASDVAKKDGRRRVFRSVESSDDGLLSRRCSVPSERATPKIASKMSGEWRFTTLAEAAEIEHRIQIRVCDEEEECQKSCTQFYSPFVKISKSDVGEEEEDVFWVPSSCRCFDEADNLI